MAVTQSSMLALGTKAPDFKLLNVVSNKMESLAQLRGKKATVVMFICNHCPFVKHIRSGLLEVVNTYQSDDIAFIAICANDAKSHPQDAPDQMREIAEQLHFSFPYLHDETQATAKAYQAECTPDFFVFDKDLKCIYRGRFDDSTPGNNIPVTGKDLRTTLDCILANKPITDEQNPSMGCNIKWK